MDQVKQEEIERVNRTTAKIKAILAEEDCDAEAVTIIYGSKSIKSEVQIIARPKAIAKLENPVVEEAPEEVIVEPSETTEGGNA